MRGLIVLGGVARIRGTSSDFGSYVDILTDMVIYAAIPFTTALVVDEKSTYIALAFLLSSYMTNMTSAFWFLARA